MLTGRLNRLPLWLLLLLILSGHVALAAAFPLLPTYNVAPLLDINKFAPSLAGGLAYATLLSALFALHWLAFRRVAAGRHTITLPVIVFVTAVLAVPLLLTYPLTSTDVYRYYIRGRITAVHGESPMETPASAFPQDPFADLAGEWETFTTPYGPVWEGVAASVAAVNGDNLLGALLSLKTLALLCHLAIGGLIWSSLAHAPPPIRAGRVVLWAWNPGLLLIFAANGHNDSLMLLWLVAGYWLWQRGRPSAGLLVMGLGALSKSIALLALPIFFVAAWRRAGGGRARLRLLLLAVGGNILIAFLLFLPFGSPLDLAARLLREAAGSGGYSITALLILMADRLRLTGLERVLVPGATVLFGLAAVWLLYRVWRGRASVVAATSAILAAYLLQAFAFRIWYAAWPLPWLLLEDPVRSNRFSGHWRLRAGLWFLMLTQLSVVIYGHLFRNVLAGDFLWSHLLGVPLTFLLPFLLARRSRILRDLRR